MDYLDIEKFKNSLKKKQSSFVYEHSLRVRELILSLNTYYKPLNLKEEFLSVIALFHDYAKNKVTKDYLDYFKKYFPLNRLKEKSVDALFHGPIASYILRDDYGCFNQDILDSIYFHSTGREGMGFYECFLFIADYCDPFKKYPERELIWETAKSNLNLAVFYILKQKILKIIQQEEFLEEISLKAYHYYNELSKKIVKKKQIPLNLRK